MEDKNGAEVIQFSVTTDPPSKVPPSAGSQLVMDRTCKEIHWLSFLSHLGLLNFFEFLFLHILSSFFFFPSSFFPSYFLLLPFFSSSTSFFFQMLSYRPGDNDEAAGGGPSAINEWYDRCHQLLTPILQYIEQYGDWNGGLPFPVMHFESN